MNRRLNERQPSARSLPEAPLLKINEMFNCKPQHKNRPRPPACFHANGSVAFKLL